MDEEVEEWHKGLSLILLLTLALPLALYILVPNWLTYGLALLITVLIMSIHEAGHVFFWLIGAFFGVHSQSPDLMIVAGGTLFQILIPLMFFSYFTIVRKYALAFIFLVILGGSIYYAGQYMSTAQAPTGIGISPFGAVNLGENPDSHDWRNMFTSLGLLEKTPVISSSTMDLGYVVTAVGIFAAVFETSIIMIGNRTKDFLLVLLYGALPAFLLFLLQFDSNKLVISLLFFIPSFAYFLKYKLPELRESYEESKKEVEREEDIKQF